MMGMVHELPDTTFSNPAQRGDYDSEAKATLTVRELQRWLALAVAAYHGQVHATLGQTPAGRWAEGVASSGRPATVTNEAAFVVEFLPVIRRTLSRSGFVIDHVQYYSDALKPWIARRERLAGLCCAVIRVTSAGSGHWIPRVGSIWRWGTGRCRGHRSACGSSAQRLPGCKRPAAPRSTRMPCSRWWSRCARSPRPRPPPPGGPAATSNGDLPSR